MAEEEEEGKEYRWETGYEKTWEAIQEDDEGLLEGSVAEIIQRAKRKRQAERCGKTRLGMMRHLYVVIDNSDCMSNQDLKPTRQLCTIKLLEGFIDEFFDQNPISQMGIIITKNKRAEKLSELAGNPRKHIKNLKAQGVRCSVIALAAEVHVCHKLCCETGGLFGVILDDCHFRDQLFQHVDPPPAATFLDSSLIKMGFPHHMVREGKEASLTLCMCHVDSSDGEGSRLNSGGYFCPQCWSKYCELPVECRACGLTLVSAPHLVRSYHHLFPVENFKELEFKDIQDTIELCFACQKRFGEHDKHVYECGTCSKIFCLECDLFIHELLHTCPGCATSHSTFQTVDSETMPPSIIL